MLERTRILIVEDEGIIARDLQQQLLNLGYEPVDIAVSGEDALAVAEVKRPQVVLMDIHLAGDMDGIDAAVRLRERLSIPSIFLTAYATDEVIERAKRAEPLGYVIKPFDEMALRTTIEIGLHRDRIDQQLRSSERRYRAVVQSAPDAIITTDGAGDVVGWSPSASVFFGYGEPEILGRSIRTLIVGSFFEEFIASAHASPHDGSGYPKPIREFEGRHREGRLFPIEVSVARWESPEGRFVTSFVRDITERRRSEGTMRLQSAALNAAANGIVITDRTGAIEWVNRAFCELTGYEAHEALGKNPRALIKSGLHDAEFYANMWSTLLSGHEWVGQIHNRRKDGSIYTEEQTITPVKDTAGTITHFIGVKRDMTDQRRLEQQFLQAQKMEVVGRLAGGVAHDFNNLLTVINGTCEMALGDLGPDDPMRTDFQSIREAGERAERLTRQLLAFSRKQVMAPTVVNLSEQVQSAAKMLRRLIGEDIELVIDAPDAHNSGLVHIDRGQLEQVLLNLAVNARDAMPDGGTLTVSTSTTELRSELAAVQPGVAAGPHVVLQVTDTGCGMTDAVREHLFEPFFTTKEKGKGTGLGLATVYGVVRQSNGFIEVESAVGHGSTFRVYLPQARTSLVAPSAAPSATRPGTETILLVEDEDGLRELTARMLRSAGYTVLTADNGRNALEAARAHHGALHLLLTDVVMPGMSGPSLAARLREVFPGMRVLFASGYTDDKLHSPALGDQRQFLAKPYSVGELVTKVRGVLDAPPHA